LFGSLPPPHEVGIGTEYIPFIFRYAPIPFSTTQGMIPSPPTSFFSTRVKISLVLNSPRGPCGTFFFFPKAGCFSQFFFFSLKIVTVRLSHRVPRPRLFFFPLFCNRLAESEFFSLLLLPLPPRLRLVRDLVLECPFLSHWRLFSRAVSLLPSLFPTHESEKPDACNCFAHRLHIAGSSFPCSTRHFSSLGTAEPFRSRPYGCVKRRFSP